MSLQVGIVGLPNVGKSTLFNALTNASVPAANYPFCTIEPNIGVVPVLDQRLQAIGETLQPETLTGSTIEFVDIAGLVQGSSEGEGLGNQFLSHIRQVDAILYVLRAFVDDNVIATYPGVDPMRDAEILETELILADIQTLQSRLDKTTRLFKTGEVRYKEEAKVLNEALAALNQGVPLRTLELPLPDDLFLLTNKPVMYVANVSDTCVPRLDEDTVQTLKPLQAKAAQQGAKVLTVSASLEEEIAQLDAEDRQTFLQELGLEVPSLHIVVQAGLGLLDLITFYTVKGPETRSWVIPRGTLAPQAAGRIHSDMERGFIRAEVVPWEKLVSLGSFALCREKGALRVEGKEYVVADGDVVQIRFAV